MRVLVCGGRDYADRGKMFSVLDDLPTVSVLINGGAKGADTLAQDWAQSRSIRCELYLPAWITEGRAAGPIRNARMLAEGKPDLVVAFPGGKGTANMVKQAREAGVDVIEIPCGEGG